MLQTFSNVTCLNAEDVPQPKHHAPTDLKGTHYELKAFILAYVTTFNKVLLLDADNFPLAKPEALFTAMSRDSSNAFEQHGSLFWPDWGQKQNDNLLAGFDVNPLAYTTFDLPVPWGNITEPMRFTESGQMLFDRCANVVCHRSTAGALLTTSDQRQRELQRSACCNAGQGMQMC